MDIDHFQPPLVAILRGLPLSDAPQIGRLLFAVGFRILEVPLNRPDALAGIRLLANCKPDDALVGGGTVTTVEEVELVYAHGGSVVVAPNFNPAVVQRAKQLQMIAVPGVATPTEALAALAAGADAIKWFPAEALGVAGLRSVKTILPRTARVWPVGGISAGNLSDWLRAGADGFGIGGRLYEPSLPLPDLEVRAREIIAAWQAR